MKSLSGFMIMPFLSEQEKKVIEDSSIHNLPVLIKKKQLSEEFYRNIIINACESTIEKIEIRRADEVFNEQEIVEKIKNEIEKSDIVIVDLTSFRPNVLYELGIAHFIDYNRTILISQDNYEDLPFDVRKFDTLKYNSCHGRFTGEIKKRINGIIEYHRTKEICIGISPFPELMIIQKELRDNKSKLVVRNIPWNETLNHFFEGEKVDIVISNSEVCHDKNRNNPTNYIYRGDIIKYNSFYVISKKKGIKTYKELSEEFPNTEDCIIKTMEQFNSNGDTIIYACNKTDHAKSFKKFNEMYGKPLIKNPIIRGDGSSKDNLKDFIQKNGDIYIGGIPERINLLKNPEYRIIIEFNDIKHDESFAKIRDGLQQKNGIVYHRIKEREIPNIDEIVKLIEHAWNSGYSKILKSKNRNTELIDEYLSEYNNSEYVKTFKFREMVLTISSKDFIENYLDENLISIE